VNKRQRKKKAKKIMNRVVSLDGVKMFFARRNGKYLFAKKLNRAIHSKKYKPFKDMQKYLRRGDAYCQTGEN